MRNPARLNQRQWLNVIILVISALVLLFIMVGRIMQQAPPVTTPANQTVKIVRIDFGDFEFRLDKGLWHSNVSSINSLMIKPIVDRWEQLLLSSAQPMTSDAIGGQMVLLYLANLAQPIVVKINLNQNFTRISFINSQQQIILGAEAYDTYFPRLK